MKKIVPCLENYSYFYRCIGEEGEGTEFARSFAFVSNGALVVNGEGRLDLIDVTGRTFLSRELHGVQNTISLPNGAAGVYPPPSAAPTR